MVTTLKSALVRQAVVSSSGWITPSPKRMRLSFNFTVVESEDNLEGTESEDNLEGTAFALTKDSNILIQQSSFLKFISDNFVCKHCNGNFRDRSILVDKIGYASNVFWQCSDKACPVKASIQATTFQVEASRNFRQKNRTTPGDLVTTPSTGK
jgi:hypothetical protein